MEGRGLERRPTANTNTNTVLRSEKLKEIDVLFRNQIREIYADSNANTYQSKKLLQQDRRNQKEKNKITINTPGNLINTPLTVPSPALMSSKSTSTLHAGDSSNSKIFHLGQEKIRASMMLKGETGRAVESLRRDNQMKELRIRELSGKCEALLMKLQSHIQPGQFQQIVEELRHCDDGKMQRLQNLVRIKKEEIFFKVKLQAVALLQEFGVSKEQVAELGAANGQDDLFSIMARLLKLRLRDFRNKQQQSCFQLQKDRILTQKQEERIHYLVETNELLRLSESKLKAKTEDLKNQLNEFLDKLKEKQHQSEQLQSQLFQMRRQNEELSSNNARLTASVKACNSELADQRRTWEARENELKQLLNNYCLEKQRLEAAIEESNAVSDELVIKLKFQKQENERLGRQLIRWKERHQGLERQHGRRTKELQQELVSLEASFEQYKREHNQGILISHRSQMEQALRRVEEYQRAYEAVQLELEDQRRLLSRAQEQHEERVSQLQSEWMQRVKVLQRLRDEELQEMQADQEARLSEIREQMEKKEALRAQEMQAHMRALLAQKDKKNTQQLVAYQCQNDQLKREVESLKDLLRAKDDFINAIKQHSK